MKKWKQLSGNEKLLIIMLIISIILVIVSWERIYNGTKDVINFYMTSNYSNCSTITFEA